MIRQEIKKYMKDNKDSMGFSHLEVWFTKKYQGVSQKECKRLLREEHDNSLLYEELEERFGQLSNEEKIYGKNVFIQEVVFVNPKVHHLSIEKYTTLSKKNYCSFSHFSVSLNR